MTPTPLNSAVSVGCTHETADVGHRGEVVDLVGPARAQRVDERALVEQVALVQRDAPAQVLDAVEALGRGAAHHAVDLVALLEQELGQVGAVLAGDAGDQCAVASSGVRRSARAATATVAAMPSRRARSAPPSPAAAAPSRPTASAAARRPGSSADARARTPPGPRRTAPRRSVRSARRSAPRAAEMLKSSPSAAGERSAATTPAAMSSTWVSVRVCSPEPKICSGRCPARTLRIRSGTACAIPGSSVGISPGP